MTVLQSAAEASARVDWDMGERGEGDSLGAGVVFLLVVGAVGMASYKQKC